MCVLKSVCVFFFNFRDHYFVSAASGNYLIVIKGVTKTVFVLCTCC